MSEPSEQQGDEPTPARSPLYRVLDYIDAHVGPYGATATTIAAGVGGLSVPDTILILRELLRRGLVRYAPGGTLTIRVAPRVKVCEGCGYVVPNHDPRCAFGKPSASEGEGA